MDWKAVGEAVAKIGLPLVGAALGGPGGAAVGTALASHIGAPDGQPESVLATLTASADAVLKAKQFEATHQETLMKDQMEFAKSAIKDETDDRSSARNLAEVDIAHGNAFSTALSALVRPSWGFSTLVLVGYSVLYKAPLDPFVHDIVDTVLKFYFGGKVIEAVMPHVAEAVATFGRRAKG